MGLGFMDFTPRFLIMDGYDVLHRSSGVKGDLSKDKLKLVKDITCKKIEKAFRKTRKISPEARDAEPGASCGALP